MFTVSRRNVLKYQLIIEIWLRDSFGSHTRQNEAIVDEIMSSKDHFEGVQVAQLEVANSMYLNDHI